MRLTSMETEIVPCERDHINILFIFYGYHPNSEQLNIFERTQYKLQLYDISVARQPYE